MLSQGQISPQTLCVADGSDGKWSPVEALAKTTLDEARQAYRDSPATAAAVRIFIWVAVAAGCIFATWHVMSYVHAVDDAAVKFQALDHFNSHH